MTREPAIIIGVIATIVVAIAVQLTADGIVTSDQGKNVLHFLEIITPIIAAAVTRLFVTPTSAPQLQAGTSVTVTDSTGSKVGKDTVSAT